MILLAITTLLLTGGAVAMVARAAFMPRMRAAERLGDISAYGFPADSDRSARDSHPAFNGFATRVGVAVAGRYGRIDTVELGRMLVRAGLYSASPQAFLGYRALATVTAPALWLWFSASMGTQSAVAVLGLGFVAIAGWTFPLTVVRKRAERRLAKVEYDLPELIDLLVVTVEAGLGFSGSVQLAASRMRGPLGEELRLTMQEQRMGLSMNAALANLLERCDTPSMRSFVRSVVQGEKLGVSIGDIMRNMAGEMRKRRWAAAEERAQKAPVKILFPLVFLIFPAMFIVLLFPALDTFLKGFG